VPVTVGEVSTTVESGGGAAGPGGAASPAPEAIEPTFAERDRHRELACRAAESAARTAGAGYGAAVGAGGRFDA